MGLDMYLYKVNKKADNQADLEEILKSKRFESEEMDAYKVYLENGNKNMYARSVFMPDFVDKYIAGDKDAVATFEKNLEEVKISYDDQMENGLIETEELGYWRKHSDLHGYFTEIYNERGGEESFNCIPLILSKNECLDVIEYSKQMIKKIEDGDDIEHTEGFFFGQTMKEDWEETIKIFEKVIEEVDFDNESVYYDSWW